MPHRCGSAPLAPCLLAATMHMPGGTTEYRPAVKLFAVGRLTPTAMDFAATQPETFCYYT